MRRGLSVPIIEETDSDTARGGNIMDRGTHRTFISTSRAGTKLARNKTMIFVVTVLASITLTNPSRLMAADTGVISKSIVSGDAWLVTDNPGPACPAPGCRRWTDIGYDDSTWVKPAVSANNGATTPESVLPGTSAQFMWHPGGEAVLDAYFRYTFTLTSTNQTLPSLAEAFAAADDYFELWINGNFVNAGYLGEHRHPNTNKWNPQLADLTPYLQDGQNVIAIRANDGDCKQRDPGTGRCLRIPDNGDIFSRGFKNVLFDGLIKTVTSGSQGSPSTLDSPDGNEVEESVQE
jgi:hypothetical protein